jgi:hypothetical protein
MKLCITAESHFLFKNGLMQLAMTSSATDVRFAGLCQQFESSRRAGGGFRGQ